MRGETSPATQQTGEALTIGQLARLTGVSAKAIRYYESVGLLPRPPRGANRYRRYSQTDVNRLLLLHRLRTLGTPLTATRTVLKQLADDVDVRCADVRKGLLALLDERLRMLDEEIASLRALRGEVAGYQRAVARCQPHPSVRYHECVAHAAPKEQATGFPYTCHTPLTLPDDHPEIHVSDVSEEEQSNEHTGCCQDCCQEPCCA
ncbi:MAG TPA: MerR family transcriptional regulator [Ktedonobacterales bacterium]|nr:MerR family transcriptional regulator [Ktedonobacterales bacterium]